MTLRILGVLAALAALVVGGDGRAGEPRRHAELHAAYYGFAVCEYCGLASAEVHDGYRREIAYLIERDGLSAETARKIRLRAWTDADLEWGNRGLGGFRNWCRTEGAAAARRFIDFRDARLAEEAGARD